MDKNICKYINFQKELKISHYGKIETALTAAIYVLKLWYRNRSKNAVAMLLGVDGPQTIDPFRNMRGKYQYF
jgi:hypothetical protein